MYIFDIVLGILYAVISLWFFIDVIIALVLLAKHFSEKRKYPDLKLNKKRFAKLLLLPMGIYLAISIILGMFSSLTETYQYVQSLLQPAQAMQMQDMYGADTSAAPTASDSPAQ